VEKGTPKKEKGINKIEENIIWKGLRKWETLMVRIYYCEVI
jgi:hypothetical protein